LARSELTASKTINEAALEWAALTITGTIVVAVVVMGFVVGNVIAGDERAIPLLIVAVVTIAMAARTFLRYGEFRRHLASGNMD
jgi:ABC-type iron transport system FetAB permease component